MVFSIPANRVKYRYSLNGLSDRDQFLLKTIIGMLNARTPHEWVFEPNNANLWISNDEAGESAGLNQQQLLQVINVSSLRDFGTDLDGNLTSTNSRISAHKIEVVLNHVVERLLLQPQQTGTSPNEMRMTAVKTYRLKRWPSSSLLLVQPLRTKIAALLLGSPLTMEQIVSKSACELTFCEAFVTELTIAGLILETQLNIQPDTAPESEQATATATAPNTDIASKQVSVFSKIRNRLKMTIIGIK